MNMHRNARRDYRSLMTVLATVFLTGTTLLASVGPAVV